MYVLLYKIHEGLCGLLLLTCLLYTSTKFDNPEGALNNYYEGKRIGEIWGYVTDGFIQDEAEAVSYTHLNCANQCPWNNIIERWLGSYIGGWSGN